MITSHLIHATDSHTIVIDRAPDETTSIKEVSMSCLSSANLEALIPEDQNHRTKPGPVLLQDRREASPNWIMQRIAKALDVQLANGSMPA
jgi:hypothetical protein